MGNCSTQDINHNLSITGNQNTKPHDTKIENESSISDTNADPKTKVFISYNHSSKVIVKDIVEKLRTEKINVWFDETDIDYGDELSKRMQQGILESSVVFCFISKLYIQSPNCRLEFFYAHTLKKKCIYLVLEKIDATDVNGIEMYLNGDALRFDIYKLLKGAAVDQEFIKNVFNKLAPILNATVENVVVDTTDEIIIKKNQDFIGRNNVFNEIDKRLSTENKTIVLYGLPGVGKTSCAKEYILKNKDLFNRYFIFNCDENYKIKQSINSYCRQLKLKLNENDSFEIKLELFTRYLIDTSENIILLLDNVENYDDLVKLIDYKLINRPTLLTSKKRKPNEKDFIEIIPFSSNDSKEYLKKKLPHITNENDLNLIINHVSIDGLCLIYKLELVAALIQNDFTLTVGELINKSSYNDIYFKTIITKIETKSKDAIIMLKYLCLLDPDYIPRKILDKIKNDSSLYQTLQAIFDYNMCTIINPNTNKFGVGIHRLLKDDIKKHYFKNHDELQSFRENLANFLNDLFVFIDNIPGNEWAEDSLIYSNVRIILETNQINSKTMGSLSHKSMLFNKYLTSDYHQCIQDGLKALKIYQIIHQKDHEEISSVLNELGLIYESMGNYESALKYQLDSYEMRKRLYKETDNPYNYFLIHVYCLPLKFKLYLTTL